MSIKEIIESKFGKGSVFRISDMESRIQEDNFISTGSKALNYILTGNSKCGWPKGRVVEIFGNEGTGKTTLALYACSEVNKLNSETLYIDVENAIDIEYAKKIGINPNLFFLTQPDCGEEAFSIAEEFLKENEKCKLIIFDSVANLVPRAEIEGDIDSNNMGLHARLMGKGLRRLVSLINKKKVCCIFVNQVRMKIGGYGNPETTTGGLALRFYSTIRMEIRTPRSGKIIENRGDLSDIIKSKENVETGIAMNIKIVKNKIYPPFRECSLSMIYGIGIDKEDDLISYFESVGLITLNGKKIEFEGKTYLRDKFLKMIEEKQFKEKIKDKIHKLTNETKIKIN